MAVTRDYLEQLAQQRFQGDMRRKFIDAIDRINEEMEFERIVSLIEAGDVEAAVQAVGLNPDNFPELEQANATAMTAAGAATVSALPVSKRQKFRFRPPNERAGREAIEQLSGTTGITQDARPTSQRITFDFTAGNPRAERAVDELNTQLMRGLNGGPGISTEGQRAVRGHIRDGLERGVNPRQVAREMRGEWDASAGRYRGGIMGLTDTQARATRRAEQELRSGDPKQLRKYLGRKLRDKRFDRSIAKAIREGKPVPEKTIQNATKGYRRKYIKFRSETVARDQALSALTKGQEESFDQMVENGAAREDQIVREWLTSRDDRVREAHQRIPRMNPGGRRRGEPFDTPLGPLRYPRDPQGSRRNTIQCRCTLTARIKSDDEVPT